LRSYPRFDHQSIIIDLFETDNIMRSTLIAAAVASLVLAGPAFAQTSATTPAIGQAVSGHNTTAAGTSGTGLHKDGSATTGSAHGQTGMQAAGVNSAGQVTGKSTAVINAAPGKADSVNAQATNTTAPATSDTDPKATGGRGKAGTKAEKEIIKANSREVMEVPGDRHKTENSAEEGRKKRAASKTKGQQKARHPGTTGQGVNAGAGS
jgi:hypothetical protein